MNHEVLRSLIPGLFFLLPLMLVAVLEASGEAALARTAAVAVAAVLPVGWIIFTSDRALQVLTRGTR